MWMKLSAIAAILFLLPVTLVAQQASIPCDRACLEGTVDKYMAAMLKHEASRTLFAENVRFTENGVELPFGNEGLWSSMVGKIGLC